jgi:hypothetical protein
MAFLADAMRAAACRLCSSVKLRLRLGRGSLISVFGTSNDADRPLSSVGT